MKIASPLGRPVSVRLPEDLRKRIETLAAATRRSQGDVVREVLERDLDKLEWEHRLVADAADLRAGRVQAVPLEELERELGLTDSPVDPRILGDIE
ncbi:MAG: ribbon-helix-helix domain-containing protein [Leucobacter sp.]